MVSEGVIEGVCTDCVVCIKRVSIRGGGGGVDSIYSDRSRPSDKGRGRGHPDPEIRRGGAVLKIWSKNKGGPPCHSSGSATDLLLVCFPSKNLIAKKYLLRITRKIINLENILGSSVSVEG